MDEVTNSQTNSPEFSPHHLRPPIIPKSLSMVMSWRLLFVQLFQEIFLS
jgi:hypothetical protein